MLAHFNSVWNCGFEAHPHGHAIGILFITGLVATVLLVRAITSQNNRKANRRRPPTRPGDLPTAPGPVGWVCQRCRSPLPVDAAYCARCGLPVSRPTPLPMPAQRVGGNSRWIVYAIIVLLGLVGLGAFLFMSDSELMPAAPQQPVQRHAPSDGW